MSSNKDFLFIVARGAAEQAKESEYKLYKVWY